RDSWSVSNKLQKEAPLRAVTTSEVIVPDHAPPHLRVPPRSPPYGGRMERRELLRPPVGCTPRSETGAVEAGEEGTSIPEGAVGDERGRGAGDPECSSVWPRLLVRGLAALVVSLAVLAAGPALASDHLDTPTVIADPAADIADLYAWTSADGRRLNLALTIVGHRFSDRVQYAFHVRSGSRFGQTTATVTIRCRFDAAGAGECWAGEADHLRGDASSPSGLEGTNRRVPGFPGPRGDPFFHNPTGTPAPPDIATGAPLRRV